MTNLSSYSFSFSFRNKIFRFIWSLVYLLFFRWTPSTFKLFKIWRVFVLKCFGAEIDYGTLIYSSAKIWAPWNLTIGPNSAVGPKVNIYNQGEITIGGNTVISQYTHLCASSHDYTKSDFPLVTQAINIGNGVWVAADAFVGPGVKIADNVVIAARAVVTKSLIANQIVGGNPAKFIKKMK